MSVKAARSWDQGGVANVSHWLNPWQHLVHHWMGSVGEMGGCLSRDDRHLLRLHRCRLKEPLHLLSYHCRLVMINNPGRGNEQLMCLLSGLQG